MTYTVFREMVLAKADGANIHRVNGKLALVVDGIRHYHSFKTHTPSELNKIEQHLFDVLVEIHKMTGVRAYVQDLLGETAPITA